MTNEQITAKLQTTDALVWAETFCQLYPSALSQIEGSEGVVQGDDFKDIMLSWFANAIEITRILDGSANP